MNIGTNIFNLRTSKGIKQSEMAEKLGLEQSGYSRIEKRGNKISYDLIEKIAEILGVSPAKLLNLDVQSEEEKVGKITAHQIEIATKDQLISDLRKIKEMTEEALEDFCDMIEHEIRMIYEVALYTELGIEEEEMVDVDGKGTGGFTFFVTNEENEIVFHNNIFKNKIVYEYFNKGFYRYSKDGFNVIEEFLQHYKSYNPQKLKSKMNNPEISNNSSWELISSNEKNGIELYSKLSEANDRIKDKERIIKMNDDVLQNIVDDIDYSIEVAFIRIGQDICMLENEKFGKISINLHGRTKIVPLFDFYQQPFFVEPKVSYDYKNLILSPDEINKIIKKIYESDDMINDLALLGNILISQLYEHDEIVEKSKYLKYFRDFNKLNVEESEQK